MRRDFWLFRPSEADFTVPPCEECDGRGYLARTTNFCTRCHGTGNETPKSPLYAFETAFVKPLEQIKQSFVLHYSHLHVSTSALAELLSESEPEEVQTGRRRAYFIPVAVAERETPCYTGQMSCVPTLAGTFAALTNAIKKPP